MWEVIYDSRDDKYSISPACTCGQCEYPSWITVIRRVNNEKLARYIARDLNENPPPTVPEFEEIPFVVATVVGKGITPIDEPWRN